ncbi:polyamine deacetylase HDAC10 isoform X4 [Hyaena hyaena]|uniref:polyamine deacetylase HDAC10 isoform X4 n=1 Tax=Hyaena hyaena TaxID=95912 RepID=UPI0019213778|nr:polyamine deacetylase HDAC10 isoform X4 [Hyaena hyaena]
MRTALVYHPDMTAARLLWEDPECEIERPERLTTALERLQQGALEQRCLQLAAREASEAELGLVHSPEYVSLLRGTETLGTGELQALSGQYDAVYFHPSTFHCARLAVGAALQLVDAVLTGAVCNGFALVRPPGHHSQRGAANGFCVFNNVAIAAEYAKQKHGLHRILIVDWDVHHGQGIQYIFEDDPSVLYFSWHRYEHGRFWPYLRESDADAVGQGQGRGFTVNLPWNQVGMGNADYVAAFLHVLLPVAFEFDPELVLISAGFDSAIGDPECPGVHPECPGCPGPLLEEPPAARISPHTESQHLLPGGESLTCIAWGTQIQGSGGPGLGRTEFPPGADVPQPHTARPHGCCPDCAGRRPGPTPRLHQALVRDEALTALGKVLHLLNGILDGQVSCGIAATPASAAAATLDVAVRHGLSRGARRLLCVAVGQLDRPADLADDGRNLWLNIRGKEASAPSTFQVSVPLPGTTGGFVSCVLALVLPLAYGFQPDLVLLALGPAHGLQAPQAALLAALLRGPAGGRVLALVEQESTSQLAGVLARVLQGEAPPSLGPFSMASPEDVQALTHLRGELEAEWKLLQVAAP